jgi:hypothetical protein
VPVAIDPGTWVRGALQAGRGSAISDGGRDCGLVAPFRRAVVSQLHSEHIIAIYLLYLGHALRPDSQH